MGSNRRWERASKAGVVDAAEAERGQGKGRDGEREARARKREGGEARKHKAGAVIRTIKKQHWSYP